MTGNPIVEREFRTNLRRSRTYLVRTAYVLALLPALLLVGAGRRTPLGTREAFLVLIWLQLATVVFLAPVFTAGVLSSERRRRTLGTLLLSELEPWQIVTGTFLPRAAYLVMVILAAVPVLILWIIFGSITGLEILASQGVILSVAVLGAAVGLFWSSLTEKAISALLASYATLMIVLALGPLAGALAGAVRLEDAAGPLPNPVGVLAEIFSVRGALTTGGIASWRWIACAALFLVPVPALLWAAGRFIHPFRYEKVVAGARAAVEAASRAFGRSRLRLAFLDRPTTQRFANPIAWKELYAARWFGLRPVFLGTTALALAAPPLWILTWSWWDSAWLHQVVVGLETYVVLLAVTMVSASSVSQEKETLSLDVLLTAPIRPHLIVDGKWYALALLFSIPLALPFGHLAFFTLVGRINPASPLVFLVCGPTAVLFFAALGLFLSTGARSVLGAQALSLAGLHAFLALGLLGLTVVPHVWFLFPPAGFFPLVLQAVRPGYAVKHADPLLRLVPLDVFGLFLLSLPGALLAFLAAGKLRSVLKERFYGFLR